MYIGHVSSKDSKLDNMPDFNFGHLVWEELGAIVLTLQRFSMDGSSSVVMDAADYRDSQGKHAYEKFMSYFLPVITNETVKYTWDYLDGFKKDFVCFKRLLVPSFTRFFLDYTDSFNEGKESLLFTFRNQVLSYYNLNPFSKPKKNRILINLKENSENLAKDGRTKFRSIANIEQVTDFLKSKFQQIQVDAIDLSQLGIKEQLREMLDTTIFLTPSGGVSMILPFIAIDSFAIIMDYYGGEKKVYFQYKNGESASMEVSFWNLWPHFNKMYYQVFSEKDVQWDFEGGTSYREDASVIIDLDRLEFMVNEALLSSE